MSKDSGLTDLTDLTDKYFEFFKHNLRNNSSINFNIRHFQDISKKKFRKTHALAMMYFFIKEHPNATGEQLKEHAKTCVLQDTFPVECISSVDLSEHIMIVKQASLVSSLGVNDTIDKCVKENFEFSTNILKSVYWLNSVVPDDKKTSLWKTIMVLHGNESDTKMSEKDIEREYNAVFQSPPESNKKDIEKLSKMLFDKIQPIDVLRDLFGPLVSDTTAVLTEDEL